MTCGKKVEYTPNKMTGTKRANQPVCIPLIFLYKSGMKSAATIGMKMKNTNDKLILLYLKNKFNVYKVKYTVDLGGLHEWPLKGNVGNSEFPQLW